MMRNIHEVKFHPLAIGSASLTAICLLINFLLIFTPKVLIERIYAHLVVEGLRGEDR